MKLLFIGGTGFVGRAMAETAMAHGHEVTLFHRGKTGVDIFPEATHILGDRISDLAKIEGEYDVLIDTSGYFPRQIRLAHEALADKVKRLVFVSTISVYASPYPELVDESSPMIELEDQETEIVSGETYGGLKVLCERAINELWGTDAWIIRPGIIVGPNDHTDRFTHWIAKASKGEPYVGPAGADQPLQFIDARDLAEFTIKGIEAEENRTVNTIGPFDAASFGTVLAELHASFGTKFSAKMVFKPEDNEEIQLPMVLPTDGSSDAMFKVNVQTCIEMGMFHRSLDETATDAIKYITERETPLKIFIEPKMEQKLLNLS